MRVIKEHGKLKLGGVGNNRKRKCRSNYAHFMYISNFTKFVSTLNKIKGRYNNKERFCQNCMHRFSSEKALKNHQRLCLLNKPQNVKMPEPGSKVKFTSFQKTVKLPMFAVADFETTLTPANNEDESIGPQLRYNKQLHSQEATTVSLVLVSSRGKVLEQMVFSEPDNRLVSRFYKELEIIWEKWSPKLNDVHTVPEMTSAENRAHFSAPRCYLCNETFGDDFDYNYKRVKDHSHSSLDGAGYLGPAHNICNINRRYQKKIHIFMHNFTKFDSNFVVQGLADVEVIKHMKQNGYGITALPSNTEHFKTLTVYDFTFLDSYSFLSVSLDKLVQELGKDYDFPLMQQMQYKKIRASDMDLNLLTRKSVFPYEFARSFHQLKSCSTFPSQEDFFSHLTQKGVGNDDYAHGKKMFEQFKCESMLEYCEIYCLLDSLLLAEVLRNYRDTTFEEFGLDICHYISSPQLSFDIMLKETQAQLELITDIDMLVFIEGSLRGGLSYVNERYVKLSENFDANEDNEFLLFLDANNLYGYTMLDYLPTHDFAWLSRQEILNIDWSAQLDKQSTGYIVECDLSIPIELHDFFESNPVASDRYAPRFGEMSRYSQETLKQTYGKSNYKWEERVGVEKLCGTLLPKLNYVVHYSNLRLFLELGIKLDHVHRVLSFKQSPWLREYVLNMTNKRMHAQSDAMKTHYKLLINSLYGKFIQAVRHYLDCHFVTSKMLLNRYALDRRFEHFKILGEKCVVFFLKKKEVLMDKAYLIGFSILEKSKFHMSNLYYNHFLKALNGHENCTVVMSDTDSFLIHCRNMTKNDALYRLKDIMDFSNYPEDHFFYNNNRTQHPGYCKDENRGNHIIEVAALRSKLYNQYVIPGEFCDISKFKQSKPKIKSIPKVAAEKIGMELFREALGFGVLSNALTTHRCTTHTIRSKNFQVSTIETLKLALCPFDNKRYILNCGIHSLPFGHYKILKYGDFCLQCNINCDTVCNCKVNCKE